MKLAINDIVQGAKNYELWMVFGLNDVQAKYRRSMLGQWWITMSVALFIFIIGTLYKDLLGDNSDNYIVYFATGYILWLFITDSVNSGCNILVKSKAFLLQQEWAISTFLYRLIYRELLFTMHHAVLIPPILIWNGLWPGMDGLALAFLGVITCIITAFWVALFLAIITLRYRDIAPLVQSFMRLAFFATPVIWVNKDLSGIVYWINLFNPLNIYLEIVRNPILNVPVTSSTWFIAIGLTSLTALLALVTLQRSKKYIIYWV